MNSLSVHATCIIVEVNIVLMEMERDIDTTRGLLKMLSPWVALSI